MDHAVAALLALEDCVSLPTVESNTMKCWKCSRAEALSQVISAVNICINLVFIVVALITSKATLNHVTTDAYKSLTTVEQETKGEVR